MGKKQETAADQVERFSRRFQAIASLARIEGLEVYGTVALLKRDKNDKSKLLHTHVYQM